jgi:PPK2 family polyphosphate:nucleotide phosphotransferase
MAPPHDLREALRVAPGTRVKLATLEHDASFGWEKKDAKHETTRQLARLTALQDRFWAEGSRSLLVVLQGIDAAGKDGTIKHVMRAFNPQGTVVSSFKAPSAEELAHDYLWRIHARVPRKGQVGIFNRSHYEDVIVVRVHGLVPRSVWSKRYEQINAFEAHLVATGTTIVKFFLSIGRDEQRERLQARFDDPSKRWKLSMGDLAERERWDDYQRAFDAALSKTSTAHAPWHIVPSDRKWFRNLSVASILADTLEDLGPKYPKVAADVPSDLVVT